MNILVFSWRDPKHPLAGGAEQVMHEHMKGWVMAGNKVTLFASSINGLPSEEIIDGIKIVRRGYQYLGVQISALFYYLHNRKNIDFIVDQFHGIPFFTPLYSSKPKLAVVQEVARKVWLLNPLPCPLNLIVGIIGFIGDPLVNLPYLNTRFMTGSLSASDDLEHYFIPKKNISVIPHGVILRLPKILPKKEKIPTITYLGVLSKDKGIEDGIRAFYLIKNRIKICQFWVIGRPETKEYGKNIYAFARRLGIISNIKFWGFVSPQEKFNLLARSHLLINPSKHEGWGLVNIEANSVGTPVVAYNSPGLIDSVKNGVSGIICKDSTPMGLANETITILNDAKKYGRIKVAGVSWSKKFSWKRSKEMSLALIKSIVI